MRFICEWLVFFSSSLCFFSSFSAQTGLTVCDTRYITKRNTCNSMVMKPATEPTKSWEMDEWNANSQNRHNEQNRTERNGTIQCAATITVSQSVTVRSNAADTAIASMYCTLYNIYPGNELGFNVWWTLSRHPYKRRDTSHRTLTQKERVLT